MKSLLKRLFTWKRSKPRDYSDNYIVGADLYRLEKDDVEMHMSGKLGPPDPDRPGSVVSAHDLEWVYLEGKKKVILKKFGNDPGRWAALRNKGREMWADPDHKPPQPSVFPVIVYIVGVLVVIGILMGIYFLGKE